MSGNDDSLEVSSNDSNPGSNLSGSDHIDAENRRIALVPPAFNDAKSSGQLAWEEKLLQEAEQRIWRRTAVFWCLLGATSLLFFLFLSHIAWVHVHDGKEIDRMLLWLLAVLPMALLFVLVKFTAEPQKTETTFVLPEQLVRLGDKLIDTTADIVKKKLDERR
ncbi:hypothetical protein [Metapseudomonas otitidis]|uniref:hypothetical protein n=1 Tax=Metapseudomonas otitidis TaxID=319939 RepID=UPI0024484524|nr:hypothetical protein [Pseudomonas otitidis]MDG9784346.1 hypothetical protein [Pseudomonas otitidis]